MSFNTSISIRGLTRVYDVPGRDDARVVALDHVDADFPTGSFTAIVGASGSGKSTLLHCMAGLDQPTSGQVSMLGTATSELKPAKRAAFRAANTGFVFQEYNLIASLTAAENVSMPSRLAGNPLPDSQIRESLEAVGLGHRANLKPHQLSGGERQRVAIARVMASQPRIVFADEPTGALDLDSTGLVLDWLRELASRGTTVVMVTHDIEAAALADSVAVMSQGRLAEWSTTRDARVIAELVHTVRALWGGGKMSTLIWKDLRHHASEWLWSLLVATVGGTIIGVVITSWWSAVQWSLAHPDGPYMLASNILGSNMVGYIGVSTAIVISTTLGLTVTAQQRSHALWKVLGIPGRRIRSVILWQVCAVGLVGGLLGGLLALPRPVCTC